MPIAKRISALNRRPKSNSVRSHKLCSISIEDPDEEGNSKNRRKTAKNRRFLFCLEKGDLSVCLVLLGITAFCLGYYYTRDWRYEIQTVEKYKDCFCSDLSKLAQRGFLSHSQN